MEKPDDVHDVRLLVVTVEHNVPHDLYGAISSGGKMPIRAQVECERIPKDRIIGLAHFGSEMVGGLRIALLNAQVMGNEIKVAPCGGR